MRDILGAQAVREMLDDLPEAIATAGGMLIFITCTSLLLFAFWGHA